MNRLASFYAVSEQVLSTQEGPTFAPMPHGGGAAAGQGMEGTRTGHRPRPDTCRESGAWSDVGRCRFCRCRERDSHFVAQCGELCPSSAQFHSGQHCFGGRDLRGDRERRHFATADSSRGDRPCRTRCAIRAQRRIAAFVRPLREPAAPQKGCARFWSDEVDRGDSGFHPARRWESGGERDNRTYCGYPRNACREGCVRVAGRRKVCGRDARPTGCGPWGHGWHSDRWWRAAASRSCRG